MECPCCGGWLSEVFDLFGEEIIWICNYCGWYEEE